MIENGMESEIKDIVELILRDYQQEKDIDKMDLVNQPDKAVIVDIVMKMVQIVFPGYFRDRCYRFYSVATSLSMLIEEVMSSLNNQITLVLKYCHSHEGKTQAEIEEMAQKLSIAFFKKIPEIRAYVDTDLQAAFDGDPAAYYKDEIILSYPGLLAITINRIAHELFLLSVPMIPRIMTEYAHSLTGIDIHPGATIGKYFFIDHGTGIVIGETTRIGENVKIYQGVTLGALSTRAGQKLKSKKRHPDIEDNVTIYAGASILGGETVIGKNSVIGSNAFITKSIAPGTRVSMKNQELEFQYKAGGTVQKSDLEQGECWYYVI